MGQTRMLTALFVSACFGTGASVSVGQQADFLQQAEIRKLQTAYEWGEKKFDEELADVEKVYAAEIKAAQAKRANGIKMARVRYVQGLKFLNVSPKCPQSLRARINEDMKRIAALPEPVAPRIDLPVIPVQEPVQRTVTVKLKTPDSGWSVRIQMAKNVNNELWVLSVLQHSEDIVNMAITTVEDSATYQARADLPVRHFVLNKTWDWKNEEDITFIQGVPDLGREWVLGKIVQRGRD